MGTLLLLLGILLLAQPARAGSLIENKSYTSPKTTIRYSLWGGTETVEMNRIICEKFVTAHPDIAVDASVYPWGQYWAKLQTQTASGLAPDVISIYTAAIGIWVDRGALMPLDALVQRAGLDLDDYYQAALDNFIWDGQIYAFPLEIALAGLVYSIDRLEESGIPPEEWPKSDQSLSWAEYETLARRLTLKNPDGSIAQYGMAGGWSWNPIMFRHRGGTVLDRQVDPTRATVAGNEALASGIIGVFEAMYGHRYHASPETVNAAGLSGDSILLSPKFAMSFLGPWTLRNFQRAGVRVGLSPPPHGPSPQQLISVNAVGIYAGAKQPEAAWKLVQFMASEAVQPIFGQRLRGVPVLKSAKDALINNDYDIKGCEAFLADLDIARPFRSDTNTYVPAAVDKWSQETERLLDNEYDRRLFALQKNYPNSPLTNDAYNAFSDQMSAFVAATVRNRLPQLQQQLDAAFARAHRQEPSPFVRTALPALILGALLAALAAYLFAVRRQHEVQTLPQPQTNWAAYLCLGPWLFGFVCFTVGPILASTLLSFTEWNMIKAPLWIGAQHYVDMFSDVYFGMGLEKTFTYAAFAIPISLIGGLTTAGLLTSNIRGADVFKAIFYFPSLFTGAAAAILWVNMFNKEYGIVNRLLSLVGIAPINWLDTDHAFFTVVLMNFFWIGGATIIYYAGMKQIPRSLYEAAEIDGAGAFRRFFNITLPMLSPVILFMVVMTTIGAFQVFTPALFFASDSSQIGAPGDALRFYSVNIYDEAFNNLHMGKACAWAVVLFLLIFAITMVQFKLSKRFVHSEG
ncbi:MAG: extracellular solute-binding protein [Candidatus Latescibacterota bacterium]|nr:extracellular solute-binding protein [Candidatus Latescibacterota bacterium]